MDPAKSNKGKGKRSPWKVLLLLLIALLLAACVIRVLSLANCLGMNSQRSKVVRVVTVSCQSTEDEASVEVEDRVEPILRNYDQSTPFVFIHIPKTSGTTCAANLEMAIEPRCKQLLLDVPQERDKFAHEGAMFQAIVKHQARSMSLNSAVKAASAAMKDPCHFAHPRNEQREYLMDLTLVKGGRLRYLLGHYPYGFCAYMERGCQYVTVMREPVSRLNSHFNSMWKNDPGFMQNNCPDCKNFSSFLQRLAAGKTDMGLDNMQTRMLSGESFWQSSSFTGCWMGLEGCDKVPLNKMTRVHLDRAINNLYSCSVVGVMEQAELWARTMDVVFDVHGDRNELSREALKSKDVSKWQLDVDRLTGQTAKPSNLMFDQLSPDDQAAFMATQALDVELYQHALKRVAAQDAHLQSDLDFLPPL